MNEQKKQFGSVPSPTLWLKKSELEAIRELVGRLDEVKEIKELADWVALKTILLQHKQLARAKTYFFLEQ